MNQEPPESHKPARDDSPSEGEPIPSASNQNTIESVANGIKVLEAEILALRSDVKKQSDTKTWKLLIVVLPILLTAMFSIVTWLVQTKVQHNYEALVRELDQRSARTNKQAEVGKKLAQLLGAILRDYHEVESGDSNMAIVTQLRSLLRYVAETPSEVAELSPGSKAKVFALVSMAEKAEMYSDNFDAKQVSPQGVVRLRALKPLVLEAYESLENNLH